MFFPATAIATWCMSRIAGFAATLALAATAMCGDFHVGGLRETGSVLRIDAVEWAIAFCLTALAEEHFFRSYLHFTLTTGTWFRFAAFLTSGVFALVHMGNRGETPIGIAQVALIGIVECIMLRRTGTLWFGVGIHAAAS